MAKTNTRRRYKGDKTRRFRWLEQCAEARVSHGAYRWAGQLAQQSNAILSKPVYGFQTKQADKISRCERSVRTYRKELEDAGLIETVRSEPERRPDGTFSRVFTNIYRFVVKPRVVSKSPGHTERQHTAGNNPSLTRDIQTLGWYVENRLGESWKPDGQDEPDPPGASKPDTPDSSSAEQKGFSAKRWFNNTRQLLH